MYMWPCHVVHVTAAAKRWTIASARQQLPELVSRAAHAPQPVYRRNQLVAAVVSPELAAAAEGLRRPQLADKLAELRQLCADEDYALTTPPRQDRSAPISSAPASRGRRGSPPRPRRRK